MKHLISLFILFFAIGAYSQEKHIRFMMFADLHYDMMPDGASRLETILQAAQKKKASFIVNMGDLSAPASAYQPLKDRLDNVSLPLFHVIGNHDTDMGKQTFMDFFGMKAPYYSVDKGKFRFIFLDSNFFIDKDSQEKDYYKANYTSSKQINRYSRQELQWLKQQLETSQICVLFSHAPINDGYDKIIDNTEIHQMLVAARDKGTPIAVIFGGHIHSDNYHVIDGLHYIQVNSASNIWGGSNFTNTERYPAETYKQYSSLKYIIPYKDALYATVDVYSNGKVKITGTKSSYLPPAPDSEKLKTKSYPCSPSIQDRKFSYK